MAITHESTGRMGKFAAPRMNIYVLDGAGNSTRVGVADYSPIHEEFLFEQIQIPSECEVILACQREGASTSQMELRCAQRQWAADALASATSPENFASVKAYVAKIPPPVPEPVVAPPEPVRTFHTPVMPREPLPVDLGLGLEQLFALVNRVDATEAKLKAIDERLKDLEAALKEFDLKSTKAQLKTFAARIEALEVDAKAQKSVMKVHLRSCRCYSGSIGFTPLD